MAIQREIQIVLSLDDRGVVAKMSGVDKQLKTTTKSTRNVSRSFQRFGRQLSITGFVIGIVARRMIRSFTQLFSTIKNLVVEASNFDKASEFLGQQLEALALSGMLTNDRLQDMLRIFQDMFDNATALAGPIAIIRGVIQDLKNAVVEGAIPAVTEFAEYLEGIDLTDFKESLRTATENFLAPLIDKVKELTSEEGLAKLGEDIETIGTLGGKFGAGIIQGLADMITSIGTLVGEDEDGSFAALSEKMGNVSVKLLALSLAMTVFGILISPMGAIYKAILGLSAIIGGPATLALAAVIGAVILNIDDWREAFNNLKEAVGGLSDALSVDLTRAIDLLKVPFYVLSTYLLGVIELIEKTIRLITTVINKLKTVPDRFVKPVYEKDLEYLGGRQGGGMIHRTGMYMLHRGETVTPRSQVTNNKPVTMNITIVNNDPHAVVREIRRVFIPL